MIPAFLHELAALIRHRIAAGQSVYVTEQMAKELELLVGLPWPDGIKAADLALGWLLAGKAMPSHGEIRYDTQCDRAAVCAELVALAAQAGRMPVVFAEPSEEIRQKYQDILRDFGNGGSVSLMTEHVQFIPGGVFPHDGTREGARAAWTFIVEQLEEVAPKVVIKAREDGPICQAGCSEISARITQQMLDDLTGPYRRELEAMR